MEHLFDYLKTSNPLHDILYFALFCAVIFFFLFIVIIAKKNGISFNFFGLFKGEADKKEASPKVEQVVKKMEEVKTSNSSGATMDELEKMLTRINFRLDTEEREQLKTLEEEKKILELELNKFKSESEKNVKTIEGLKSENIILNKKVDALNKEIKMLKLDKHPDILTFDKALYQLNTSLYELYTEMLSKDHISRYRDTDEFKNYVNNRTGVIIPYIRKHVEKLYTNGTLVKTINEVFMDTSNNTFKSIYKNIHIGFDELRKVSLFYHDISQKIYKENLGKLEYSISSYLRNLSHEIKNNVSNIQNNTPEQILKLYLKRDVLFDLVIDNEMNSMEVNNNSRNEMREKRKEICMSTIDSIIKTLETYFKDKVVKTAMLRMKQKGE